MSFISKMLMYISGASVLFPFIIGIIYYRTFKNPLKVLFYYICTACVIESVSLYYSLNGMNSLFISHLCTVVEFAAFTYMYINLLSIKPFKPVYYILTFLFTAFVGADVFYFSGYERIGVASRNTEAVILIVFAIVYFYRLMVKAEHANILKLPAFWINAGVLIYFSGNFFLILFSNYLIASSELSYLIFFTIHSVFNITFNTSIAMGFLKQKHDS